MGEQVLEEALRADPPAPRSGQGPPEARGAEVGCPCLQGHGPAAPQPRTAGTKGLSQLPAAWQLWPLAAWDTALSWPRGSPG